MFLWHCLIGIPPDSLQQRPRLSQWVVLAPWLANAQEFFQNVCSILECFEQTPEGDHISACFCRIQTLIATCRYDTKSKRLFLKRGAPWKHRISLKCFDIGPLVEHQVYDQEGAFRLEDLFVARSWAVAECFTKEQNRNSWYGSWYGVVPHECHGHWCYLREQKWRFAPEKWSTDPRFWSYWSDLPFIV